MSMATLDATGCRLGQLLIPPAIIYKLPNNILMNNSVAWLYFIMTRIALFSYGYARQIINNGKNAAASLAISMAMQIRGYGAKRIAQ
jgi:hypothetical protein